MYSIEVTWCYDCMQNCKCAGQPVGWCISDSEASEIIEAFLGALQRRSPSTSVNVIMTDDGMYFNVYISHIIK